MRLSELQDKDVISVKDGRKIGNIVDICVTYDGKMQSLIVEGVKGLHIFSAKEELEIKWEQIEKIGEDVILVKLLL